MIQFSKPNQKRSNLSIGFPSHCCIKQYNSRILICVFVFQIFYSTNFNIYIPIEESIFYFIHNIAFKFSIT